MERPGLLNLKAVHGFREVALFVRCLLHGHEDLSSIPTTHVKRLDAVFVSIIPVLGKQRQTDGGVCMCVCMCVCARACGCV